MNQDNNPEHRRYAQRLNGLEQRQASQASNVDNQRIGKKVIGIRQLRFRSSSMRIGLLCTVFGVILLISLYVISPFSKIRQISVTGNRELSDQAVYQATTVRPGRMIWSAFFGQHWLAEEARVNNPQIKNIQVHLTGLQSVRVTVAENSLLGIAQGKQLSYAVLSNGHLQATTSHQEGIDFRGFGRHHDQLRTLGKQLGMLKPAVFHDIATIKYQPTTSSPHQVIMYMKDGNTVKANLTTVGKKMKYYPAIAATMKDQGVVDLRVGAYSYAYGTKDK